MERVCLIKITKPKATKKKQELYFPKENESSIDGWCKEERARHEWKGGVEKKERKKVIEEGSYDLGLLHITNIPQKTGKSVLVTVWQLKRERRFLSESFKPELTVREKKRRLTTPTFLSWSLLTPCHFSHYTRKKRVWFRSFSKEKSKKIKVNGPEKRMKREWNRSGGRLPRNEDWFLCRRRRRRKNIKKK